MVTNYQNYSINTTLEFRPQEDWSIFATGGYNNYNVLLHQSTTGPQILNREDAYVQWRSQYKGLFTQVAYNINDGSANGKESHVYQTGLINSADRNVFGLYSNIHRPNTVRPDWNKGSIIFQKKTLRSNDYLLRRVFGNRN